MTIQAAAEFLSRARTDDQLRGQLLSAASDDAYLEVARGSGYDVTLEQLRGVARAERFFLAAREDAVLSRRLSSADSEQALLALVEEAGFTCTVEELKAVGTATPGDQLSDEQLEAIAGGVGFSIVRTPAPPFGSVPVPYPSF